MRVELEDVVRAVESVDSVSVQWSPEPIARSRRLAARADAVRARLESFAYHTRLGRGASRPYRLAIVWAQFIDDLYAFAPLSRLLAKAETTACRIEEVYAAHVPENRHVLGLLRQFDLLFAGCAGSVRALEHATGRACAYLPPSVDALAASTRALATERVIDVLSLGRRAPRIHEALLARARRTGAFYVHDTISNATTFDHRAHRAQLFDRIRRSRYFVVHPARCDDLRATGGQEELGFRYFEGAAAGAVLVGELPRTDVARDLFSWPDAVVQIGDDPSSIDEVLDTLDASPGRVEAARRANVANVLRRHDHASRWADVLRCAGLAPSPALVERRRALDALADGVMRAPGAYAVGHPGAPVASE